MTTVHGPDGTKRICSVDALFGARIPETLIRLGIELNTPMHDLWHNVILLLRLESANLDRLIKVRPDCQYESHPVNKQSEV